MIKTTNTNLLGICELVEYQSSRSLKLQDVDKTVVPRILRARTALALSFAAGRMQNVPYKLEGAEGSHYLAYSLKNDFSKLSSDEYLMFMFCKETESYLQNDMKDSVGVMPFNMAESAGITSQPCIIVIRDDFSVKDFIFQMKTSLRWLSERSNAQTIYRQFDLPDDVDKIDEMLEDEVSKMQKTDTVSL